MNHDIILDICYRNISHMYELHFKKMILLIKLDDTILSDLKIVQNAKCSYA